MAAKNAPSAPNKVAGSGASTAPRQVAPPPKPKPAQSGTNQWLDSLSDVKVAQPEPPPQRPKIPSPPVQRDRVNGPGGSRPSGPPSHGQRDANAPRGNGPGRGPAAYHVSNGNTLTASPGQRPSQPHRPSEGGPNRSGHGKPWAKNASPGGPRGGKKPKVPKPAPAPKPKREKTPPPEPFTPAPEQITQVEERYLMLAQPSEFDGIRTQIAKEFSIPKKAVKKIIKDLRDRQHIPSWWEIQTYKGSQEELDRIKAIYEPYLPVPPVGVHKKISETLDLKPGTVYQAIKAIRTELNLPQYNDPKFHEEELAEHIKRAQAKKAAAEAAKAAPAENKDEGGEKKDAAEAGKETVAAPSTPAETSAVASESDSSPTAHE
ncbi:hypothetical protein KSZ_52960 [Dictyobacter formicarum]|uniref:Uncharacterized protein n=1 Tax=Dictyobacter formicarum TaxID=2778368 RepID=A0ABQ3VM40_9CHLR|nr:hypothetical protein KSZ_52960 [Dictyobacter formicarum]